jgi:hypothetical protein
VTDIKPAHLHLRTFTTIYHEVTVLNHKILTGREASVGRNGAAGTKNGKLEQRELRFTV